MSSAGRSERVNLRQFNAAAEETVVQHTHEQGKTQEEYKKKKGYGRGWIGSILLFVFFVFVVFVILVAWRPKWLQKKAKDSCEEGSGASGSRKRSRKFSCIDYGKAFAWAIVLSIIAIILFMLLAGVTAGIAAAFMGKKKSSSKLY